MSIPYSGEQFVESNGIKICYDTFGDRNNPAFVLIMGLASQMVTWEVEFCETIAKAGYFVIRFDNRDVGLSTKFDDAPIPDVIALYQGQPIEVPYLLIDMAKDAIGLLDALEIEKAHICGASMGGMIVQTIAINFPERILSLTSIMSTTSDPTLPPPNPDAMAVLIAPPEPEREAHIRKGIESWKILSGGVLPFDEELAKNRVARAFDRSYYPDGAGRQLGAVLASGSRKEALKNVKRPALVIHGDADPLVKIEGGKDTANSIPGAKFSEFAGMGHDIPPQHAPKIIEEIIEHINSVK